MLRSFERRTRAPLALELVCLAAALASGCGHGAPTPDRAAGAPGPATANTATCGGGGKASEDCCLAMTNEGDALLASGNRQGAYDRYEETRSLCPKFHPVRKRLYLVKQTAPAPAPDRADAPTIDANVSVNFDLHLDPDVRGIAHATYLDGDFVQPGRLVTGLHPGAHDLAVEVYVQPKSDDLQAARLDVHQAVVLPASLVGRKALRGGAIVHVTDRGGAGTLAERLSFTSEPMDFESVVMLSVQAGGERLLTDVTKDPHRPQLPPKLNRAGMQIWGLFKVCVDKAGAVTGVTTMKSADRLVDEDWMAIIRTWRYQPYLDDGRAVSFCHAMRLQVGADFDPKVAK
jgi:hypothetical protein